MSENQSQKQPTPGTPGYKSGVVICGTPNQIREYGTAYNAYRGYFDESTQTFVPYADATGKPCDPVFSNPKYNPFSVADALRTLPESGAIWFDVPGIPREANTDWKKLAIACARWERSAAFAE